MASESNKDCTICSQLGLRPFTKANIMNYYIPLHGVVSYSALAVNVMNPSLVAKVLPKKDMSNVLLLSTMAGTAFYLYGRPHLQVLPNSRRGLYALLGSTLFSMGSVLVWAVVKSTLPRNNAVLTTFVGLALGATIVKLSTDYFADCDKVVAKD